MSKKLVGYFSASGVTAKVARTLAEAVGANLFEIAPKKPYTKADLNWMDANARSTVEMKDPGSRPELAAGLPDAAAYDTIYVGFPIWWYVAPTIVNTFLESLDLSGKTVVPFATSGGSGMGGEDVLRSACSKGTKWLPGKRLSSRESMASVQKWVESLGL